MKQSWTQTDIHIQADGFLTDIIFLPETEVDIKLMSSGPIAVTRDQFKLPQSHPKIGDWKSARTQPEAFLYSQKSPIYYTTGSGSTR